MSFPRTSIDLVADSPEPLLQSCTICGAVLDVSDEEPLSEVGCPACGAQHKVRASIGHFELVDVVGRGGMGVVYRAHDTSLDRDVALKLLRRDKSEDEQFIAQLEAEAGITASINHPHVVKVFSTGTDRGRFYIAMELVDCGTLDSLITLQGRVAEAQVLDVGIQIAQGLRAAQQHGLIHRDVKPGNILFANSHTAKIVDFGLAIFMEDEESARGEIWGTPYYVAPEKLDNKPEDFRSDMYSLGGTLFHALAGRPPFEAEDASMVALKHLKTQPVSLQAYAPWVSGPTAFVINKTLSKDPDQRYQSFDEMIEHLEYAKEELRKTGGKPAEQKRVVLEDEGSQKAMGWVVIAMFGIIVLAAAGFFLLRGKMGGEKATAATATIVGANAKTKYDEPYEAARRMLIAGDAAGAAQAFERLSAEKVPQPMLNWALLHEGLAKFAAGQTVEARATFRRLRERALYSTEPGAQALAGFFLETAERSMDERPIPASAAKGLNRSNHEALALLVYALKDWQLGAFDDAGTMLRQFDSAQPAGGSEWVKQYGKLTDNYLSDFTNYREAAEAVKMAITPDQQRTALKVVDSARAGLKLRGKLAERIDAMRKEIGTATLPPGQSTPATKLANTPWTFGDIGATGLAGGAKFNSATKVFTVSGAGADIWTGEDGFHFLWQQITGDFEIVARVIGVSESDPWAKGGLMLRNHLTPDSRNVFVCVSARNGISHQRRPATASLTTSDKFPGIASPHWLKLVRIGDTVTSFRSPDGAAWTLLASDTLGKLPKKVFVGLAVSAHHATALCTATFDNVTVSTGVGGSTVP